MRKSQVRLVLVVGFLACLAGGYVAGGLWSYARYQSGRGLDHCGGLSPVHICVVPPVPLFTALYPAAVAAHVPLFPITYRSESPQTLVIAVSILGFTQVQQQFVQATASVQTVSFSPPLLSTQVLRQLVHEQISNLHVVVTDTHGNTYFAADRPLLLYAHNLLQWSQKSTQRLQIVAWVTPQDPTVEALVKKAGRYLAQQPPPVPHGLIGYNKANPHDVRDQVDALFDSLRLAANLTCEYAQVSGDVFPPTQQIRLPEETLRDQHGNNLEVTLLLASAAENLGLHTEIVLLRGHVLLGVATSAHGKQNEYWDGATLQNGVAGDSANISADARYRQNKGKLVDTLVISVARRQGIGPMF
jgi:hypothetical protein